MDLTPPVFTGNTPYTQNKKATAFDLVVQQNKAGRVFYIVVEQVTPLQSILRTELKLSYVGCSTNNYSSA